jgi:hypothetical protein
VNVSLNCRCPKENLPRKKSMIQQTEKPPRGGPSNLFAGLFVQAIACAFRFLRRPSKPKPMPVAGLT